MDNTNTNTTTQSKTFDPLTHPIIPLGVGTRLEEFYARQGPRQRRERQAVACILDALAACGFTPNGGEVLDGFGHEESGKAHDTKTALEACFNLDESRVYMRDTEGRDVGHLYFVMGESPEEVLCDYSWKSAQADEPKGFKVCVDRISDAVSEGKRFTVTDGTIMVEGEEPVSESPLCKHGRTGPHERIAGEECEGPWKVA